MKISCTIKTVYVKNFLKTVISENKITLKEISIDTGISTSTLHNILKGKTKTTNLKHVLAMTKHYNCLVCLEKDGLRIKPDFTLYNIKIDSFFSGRPHKIRKATIKITDPHWIKAYMGIAASLQYLIDIECGKRVIGQKILESFE